MRFLETSTADDPMAELNKSVKENSGASGSKNLRDQKQLDKLEKRMGRTIKVNGDLILKPTAATDLLLNDVKSAPKAID